MGARGYQGNLTVSLRSCVLFVGWLVMSLRDFFLIVF
jgi:hypothetical protein